jgi:ABC-type bacteriocin/lantibiotic exporter with double-glycine peptidase domain
LKWGFAKEAASILPLAFIIVYLSSGLMKGSVAFPDLFFYWGSVQALTRGFSSMSRILTTIRHGLINHTYRREFLAMQPMINESGAMAYRFKTTPRIELNHVSFCYPRHDELVIGNCSLSFEPGARVALVGKNGSGKTTLIRLLSKIYLANEGEVLIDGIPLNHLTQSSWWEQLVYSTQDTSVPEFTVEEAVTGGASDQVDRSRLEHAAELSGSKTVIESLPLGYRTQIGPDWEDGWQPSTGQEQRLKLAAALYRLSEPQVRIGLFDEPMSQCDVETRERFYRILRTIGNKTVIVVAHDPVYLHFFERVILIENGRVARDMRTPEEIQAYQQETVPQFKHQQSSSVVALKH